MSATSDEMPGSAEPGPDSLKQAKTPLGMGMQPVLGVIWSLILIALGVAAVREALVFAGAFSGASWSEQAAANLDGRTAPDWMIPIGAGVALLGLLLVLAALRRRPQRGVRLKATTGIFLSSGSIERLAKAAANDVDGVDTDSVSGTRHKVTIDATTFGSESGNTQERIEAGVRHRLSALETAPTVRVRLRRTEELT